MISYENGYRIRGYCEMIFSPTPIKWRRYKRPKDKRPKYKRPYEVKDLKTKDLKGHRP